MIYIRIEQETGLVKYIHMNPLDPVYGTGKSKEELEKTGLFIDESQYHEPIAKENYFAIMYYNEEDGIYYKYEKRPLTTNERLDKLEEMMKNILSAE